MTLREALEEMPPKPVRRSRLEQYLESLDDADRDLFDEIVTDTANWSNRRVAELLTRAGFPIGETAIWSYRKKEGL